MSSLLLQNNDHFNFAEITDSYSKLPVGNYLLCFNETSGQYYLKKQEAFSIPSKIYGDYSYIKRWKTSFETTEKNLGVLLSGYKGSGKTLIARKFCADMNVPVIFITQSFKGPAFEDFITNPLLKNSIILIDEFEKVYSNDSYEEYQESLLSIMDGIYNTHLLFLLTVNDVKDVNDKLKNRLGRVKYNKAFFSLPEDVISEVIEDLLEDATKKESILNVLEYIPTISFDILTNIIKDMNLFNEPAEEVVKHLNLVKEETYFDGIVKYEGKIYPIYPSNTTLPDGKYEIYYMRESDTSVTEDFPEGRIFLKNYTCKKITGGFQFDLGNGFELLLYPSDNIGMLF